MALIWKHHVHTNNFSEVVIEWRLADGRSNAEVVLAQLPDAFTHFNEVHPHSSLKLKSPRMFGRGLARWAQENGAN
jgi:transposase InsO family protein